MIGGWRISRLCGLCVLLLACSKFRAKADDHKPDTGVANVRASASIALPDTPSTPRPKMAWIAAGPLVAGSAPDSVPRLADREMAGEQVILKAYYIDIFPYPNEEGAIPTTNVTQSEAAELCAEQGKRLCSELEWEKACKGPSHLRYEYGEAYKAERCTTGTLSHMRPSGIRVTCRSDYGVHDMHGGVWEWTASRWGREVPGDQVSLRGGNGVDGELIGRCANAKASPPQTRAPSIGFRCCFGAKNDVEVSVRPDKRPILVPRDRVDKSLIKILERNLPEEVSKALFRRGDPLADRMWFWHPVANEELVVVRVCSGLGRRSECGVAILRLSLDAPTVLAWASSGQWLPTLKFEGSGETLELQGGDVQGTFQRQILYTAGRIKLGAEERKHPIPKKKNGS